MSRVGGRHNALHTFSFPSVFSFLLLLTQAGKCILTKCSFSKPLCKVQLLLYFYVLTTFTRRKHWTFFLKVLQYRPLVHLHYLVLQPPLRCTWSKALLAQSLITHMLLWTSLDRWLEQQPQAQVCSVITEGSGLVLPIQVYSLFKMVSVTPGYELEKMQKYSAKKEGGIGLHNWPV